MKRKIMFGIQVFTTLILFMAIFVTYLERKDVKENGQYEKNEITNSSLGSNGSIVDFISKTFTTSFSGVISSGK